MTQFAILNRLQRLPQGSPTSSLALLSVASVAIVAVALAYLRTRNLDAEAALNGFSPEQLAVSVNHPELMAGNFPSGILNNLNSLVYAVYPWADRAGLPAVNAWAGMIYLEIAVFAAVAVYSVRSLLPGAGWPLAAVVAITFLVSSFLSPDMANLEFPFYGWVYAFAHASFLWAACAVIGRRYLATACAITLCFLIHPIIGLFTAVFAGAAVVIQILDGEPIEVRKLLIAAAMVAAGCGAWIVFIVLRATVTAGGVDPATFVALNKAQNFHWFPSYLGQYLEQSFRALLPLLSTLALTAWAFNRAQPLVPLCVARQLAFGVIVLMGVCCVGLAIAEFAPWPPLVKLALHRADRNALIVAALLIYPALYRDLQDGDAVERALAVVLIAVPFVSNTGFVLLAVAPRVIYAGAIDWRQGRWTASLTLSFTLLALVGLLLIIYNAHGLTMPWAWSGLLNGLGAVAALTACVWYGKNAAHGKARPIAVVLLLAAVTAGGLYAVPRKQGFRNEAERAKADSALQAQLWIRDNTPPGALLMVDPSLYYFGRDKSHRPSFGTPREWLLVPVLYDSNRKLLEEGLRRYRALGLAEPTYIYDPSNRRIGPLFDRINGEAEKRFYAMSGEELRKLATTYVVRYFVFQKAKLKADPPLPVVYRNSHFVIAAAP